MSRMKRHRAFDVAEHSKAEQKQHLAVTATSCFIIDWTLRTHTYLPGTKTLQILEAREKDMILLLLLDASLSMAS